MKGYGGKRELFRGTKVLPIAAGVVTAVIWGFSFIFTKDLLNHTFPNQVLGLRFATAVIVLLVLKGFGFIKLDFENKRWQTLIPLSIFQPGFYFLGETWGVNWTTASEAGMVIALAPIASTLIARAVLKEQVSLLQYLCILTSIAGVFVIVVARNGLEFGRHLSGVAVLILAVIAQAIYSILSKKSSEEFSPVEITYVMMCSGAIIFNVMGVVQSLTSGTAASYFNPLGIPSVIVGILYLGGLASVCAFFMFNYALANLKVSQTTIMLNLIPLVSLFGGVVFQNDPFGWQQAIGIALILLGVWGTTFFGTKMNKAL